MMLINRKHYIPLTGGWREGGPEGEGGGGEGEGGGKELGIS